MACNGEVQNVVTYVARRGKNAGQRFYKCRNHNPSAGGCDFYRWQDGYAAHLANLEGGEAVVGQIGRGYMLAAAPVAGRQGVTVADAASINLWYQNQTW
uniref:GRF-type domain-containing protein n=1 Tax=Aegilops tauschii TaxID=37682 RepID=N1QWQ2_AEGTA